MSAATIIPAPDEPVPVYKLPTGAEQRCRTIRLTPQGARYLDAMSETERRFLRWLNRGQP